MLGATRRDTLRGTARPFLRLPCFSRADRSLRMSKNLVTDGDKNPRQITASFAILT